MMYYAIGDALITPTEFSKNLKNGTITQFYNEYSQKHKPETLQFSSGELNYKNVITPESVKLGPVRQKRLTVSTAEKLTREFISHEIGLIDAEPRQKKKSDQIKRTVQRKEETPFTEIGPGKPLTVMIRAVYTGKFPEKSIFKSSPEMLVTSAIKDIASGNAQPLALNYIMHVENCHDHLSRPNASTIGTPYIYYSPAVLADSLTIDLNIAFENKMDPELFNAIGSVFVAAGGLPIFMPYSTLLLAFGGVLKLGGELGKKFFVKAAEFSATQPLDFKLAGGYQHPSGFAVVVDKKVNSSFLEEYQIKVKPPNNKVVLVDKDGREYDGENPYIILSFDGMENDKLNNFLPAAVSAAMLNKFYGIKTGATQKDSMDTLIDAFKLYNDFKLRSEIDSLNKQNEGLADTDDKKKKNLSKIDALKANIQTDVMKVK